MPSIPKASETVRDFGTGVTQPASMTPIYYGYGSLATPHVLNFYSSPNTLRDESGEGHGVEAAVECLTNGGGPVGFIGSDPTIAATIGHVVGEYSENGTIGAVDFKNAADDGAGTGPTVSLAGAATVTGSFTLKIQIQTGGALGTGTFRWSRDDGATWEESNITLPVGTTYTFPDTGITATFAAGTYVQNESYTSIVTSGGGDIAITGTPALDSLVRIEIVVGGANGVATFRYALDGYSGDTASERTYSEVLTVPSGGTFAVPYLGITLTFDDTRDFVAGDYYLCAVEAPAWNSSDLAECFAALGADPSRWRFVVPITSNGNGDATAHAVLTAALQSQLNSLATASKYRRGMIAATHVDTPATAKTAFLNTVAARCLVSHGQVKRASAKAFPGFGFPVTNAVDVIAARAAASLPSTDLKRVRSGSLPGIVKLFHDERLAPSGLDDVKVSTLRTYENRDGYYITQGRLKSPSGSDFKYWPIGIVMDIACETINDVMTEQIGRGVRYGTVVVNDISYPGAIDDRDATTIDDEAGQRLASQLLTPQNAEGFDGHVTAISVRVSRTHNVLSTGVILCTVGIKGLAYIDYVETTLGFVVDLPLAA